jgi:hypothetical protein
MNTHSGVNDPSKQPPLPQIKGKRRQRAKRVQLHRRKQETHKDSGQPERLAWPIAEGARRVGVSRTSIYKLAAQGKVRLIKVLGRSLLPESEVVRLVENGSD